MRIGDDAVRVYEDCALAVRISVRISVRIGDIVFVGLDIGEGI